MSSGNIWKSSKVFLLEFYLVDVVIMETIKDSNGFEILN